MRLIKSSLKVNKEEIVHQYSVRRTTKRQGTIEREGGSPPEPTPRPEINLLCTPRAPAGNRAAPRH